MISYDEAIALILAEARPIGKELVSLAGAHGRVLAEPVTAGISAPRADVSTMDGYAVRMADLAALPARLSVIGESFPGKGFDGRIAAGMTVRIFTGAPVPAGADAIVIQENARREGGFAEMLAPGERGFIRRAGSDFAAGELVLPAGTLLGPRALVAAGGADVSRLSVYRRPQMVLIATGDELVDPGEAASRASAVPESVSLGVAALARDWGAEPAGSIRLADNLPAMIGPAHDAAVAADLVVVTGGASVGERDFAKAMFGDALALVFSKISMKPGKPVWLGRAGNALVLGLPGNPTSALVTARLLLAPLIAGLCGRDPDCALRWRAEPLAEAIGAAGDRETFARGMLMNGVVRLLPNQDSGAQGVLAGADLLVRRPSGDAGLAAGDAVRTLAF